MILMFFLGMMFATMMGLSIAHGVNDKSHHAIGYLVVAFIILIFSIVESLA